MDTILIYILQSAAGLLLFYSVYKLFLKNETFFRLNRLYLLATIILSLTAPLFSITYTVQTTSEEINSGELFRFPWQTPKYYKQVIKETKNDQITVLEEINIYTNPTLLEEVEVNSSSEINTGKIKVIILIYWTIVIVLFARMLWQSAILLGYIFGSRVVFINGIKVAVIRKNIAPFSFLGYICINEDDLQDGGSEIITHENEHVRQKHFIDLLFVEIVSIFLWFNPLIWLFGKEIRETHEYLADNGVIARGFDKAGYQALILSQVFGVQLAGITNNFNKSLIKKRITMMQKMKSPKIAVLKVTAMIPVLLILLFAFASPQYIVAQEIEQEEVKEEVFTAVEYMPQFPGGELALRKFIAKNTNYPKEAKEKGIEGKVYVSFVVDKTGDVKDVKLAKGVNELLDKEAIRLVKNLPTWQPGCSRCKPQDVTFTIPINFELPKKEDVEIIPVKQTSNDDSIYFVVEEMPLYKGGEKALRKFLASNTKYPAEAAAKGIQGKVYVRFAVMKDGSVQKVQVMRGVHKLLDSEAERVVKMMPAWEAGKQGGKNVNVWFTVPINFKLDSEQSENKNPLILVNGERYKGNVKNIEPDRIEKILVIKGTEAISKFGQQAEHGAILIELKEKEISTINSMRNVVEADDAGEIQVSENMKIYPKPMVNFRSAQPQN